MVRVPTLLMMASLKLRHRGRWLKLRRRGGDSQAVSLVATQQYVVAILADSSTVHLHDPGRFHPHMFTLRHWVSVEDVVVLIFADMPYVFGAVYSAPYGSTVNINKEHQHE